MVDLINVLTASASRPWLRTTQIARIQRGADDIRIFVAKHRNRNATVTIQLWSTRQHEQFAAPTQFCVKLDSVEVLPLVESLLQAYVEATK